MVIFGIRGDLAKRLLAPALYNLRAAGLLGDGFQVIGVDHGDNNDAGIRRDLGDFLESLSEAKDSPLAKTPLDRDMWSWLADRITYQQGDFQEKATYEALGRSLADKGDGSALFYMAVAPRFFTDIAEQLSGAGLLKERDAGVFRRLVVEKPFGVDLDSARALNQSLARCLDESQLYRIDHFLGKETVRNIMVTRFGNDVFEPLWNRLHIDSVQITAAETVGVEGRGSFYETTGALRDMVPNHLCQLLGMIAMEPPNDLGADAVRGEKGRVIEAIRKVGPAEARADMVAGQYAAGRVAGHEVAAYRASPKVAADSEVETFIALKLEIDNWRWSGVPFYLRTGKAMSAHETQISIHFKAVPRILFQNRPDGPSASNVLVMNIQPDQGVSMLIDAKRPGPDIELAQVSMAFRYADQFEARPATGYETLIYDCLIGDPTLFNRGQDIEAGWAAVMPFLEVLKAGGVVDPYEAGTDGPPAAGELLARDGRAWRPIG
jgi:glucose-6-phosphate 1-dehydrogenase